MTDDDVALPDAHHATAETTEGGRSLISRGTSNNFVSLKQLQRDERVLRQVQGMTPDVPREEFGGKGREGEGESESSFSSSSESSDDGHGSEEEQEEQADEEEYEQPSFRPTFQPSSSRPAPVNASNANEAELEADAYARRRRAAQEALTAALNAEEAVVQRDDALPDDEDYEEEREAEYAKWKVRELKRIIREREADKAWKTRFERAEGKGKDNNAEVGKGKVGPFFQDVDEAGKLKEKIYERDETPLEAVSRIQRARDGQSGRARRKSTAVQPG